MRDARGRLCDGQPVREPSLVEVVTSGAEEREARRSWRRDELRGPTEVLEVTHALRFATEHAELRLEGLVGTELPEVALGQVLRGAKVVSNRELRLVGVARGVGGLEVEAGRALDGVALHEVPCDDGRGHATRERRLGEVLAERAMHARARRRVERRVRHVTRQRVTEVEDVTFAIAQAASAEPHDGILARAE